MNPDDYRADPDLLRPWRDVRAQIRHILTTTEPKMQRAYTQPEDVAFTYESARQAAVDARRRWREQRDQPCYCLTCEVHRNGLVEGLRPFVPPWALKLIEEDLARQADGEDVPEK